MSATGRSDVRVTDDFYATPPFCTRRLLEALPLPGGLWLEPCAGEGHIIREVDAYRRERGLERVEWAAIEKRPECEVALRAAGVRHVFVGRDALDPALNWAGTKVVLTNPPFSLAEEFIRKARAGDVEHAVWLLRLNYLGSAKRHPLFAERMPDVYVLPQRPSFTGHGTDATEYAWIHETRAAVATGSIRLLGLTPSEER